VRVPSVSKSDATGRPRRSVLSLGHSGGCRGSFISRIVGRGVSDSVGALGGWRVLILHMTTPLTDSRARRVESGDRGPALPQPGSVRQRRGRVPVSCCSPQSRCACAAALDHSGSRHETRHFRDLRVVGFRAVWSRPVGRLLSILVMRTSFTDSRVCREGRAFSSCSGATGRPWSNQSSERMSARHVICRSGSPLQGAHRSSCR
jgi:hypothetical protein